MGYVSDAAFTVLWPKVHDWRLVVDVAPHGEIAIARRSIWVVVVVAPMVGPAPISMFPTHIHRVSKDPQLVEGIRPDDAQSGIFDHLTYCH